MPGFDLSTRKKFRMAVICPVLMILILPYRAHAREVILDSIYLAQNSQIYKNLIDLKLEAYKIAEAVPVDSNVIFSDWKDGKTLIYIKEFRQSEINYIYRYETSQRKTVRLAQVDGAVIFAMLSPSGKWLIMKTITFDGDKTVPNLIIFDTRNNNTRVTNGKTYFNDCTFTPEGSGYVSHTEKGITEKNFTDGTENIILPVKSYTGQLTDGNTTAAHISPDRKRIAVLTGGGGIYRCIIFKNGKVDYVLNNVSSCSEFFWINSRSFVYRNGYTAYYSAEIFDTVTHKSRRIGKPTLNTNIQFSSKTGIITFLNESLINSYNFRSSSFFSAPIEGEDIHFAPDRNTFCIIFNNSLFILKKSVIESKMFFLKRNSNKIADIYKKALENRKLHENEFSRQFLIRKLDIYGGFSGK